MRPERPYLAEARVVADEAAAAIVGVEVALGRRAPNSTAVAAAWRALVDRVELGKFDLSEATLLALHSPLVATPVSAFGPGLGGCTGWAAFLDELGWVVDEDALDSGAFVLGQLANGGYVGEGAASLGFLAANGVLLSGGLPAVWPVDASWTEAFEACGPPCWDPSGLRGEVARAVWRVTGHFVT